MTMTGPAVTGRGADRRTVGPAVAAWVSGLVIGPASLDVTAPGTAVVRTYAGQQSPAIIISSHALTRRPVRPSRS